MLRENNALRFALYRPQSYTPLPGELLLLLVRGPGGGQFVLTHYQVGNVLVAKVTGGLRIQPIQLSSAWSPRSLSCSYLVMLCCDKEDTRYVQLVNTTLFSDVRPRLLAASTPHRLTITYTDRLGLL